MCGVQKKAWLPLIKNRCAIKLNLNKPTQLHHESPHHSASPCAPSALHLSPHFVFEIFHSSHFFFFFFFFLFLFLFFLFLITHSLHCSILQTTWLSFLFCSVPLFCVPWKSINYFFSSFLPLPSTRHNFIPFSSSFFFLLHNSRFNLCSNFIFFILPHPPH